jgi:cell wall-associated NlpC family hydrolase
MPNAARPPFDRRITPIRDDLAAAHLRDTLAAAGEAGTRRFAEPTPWQVAASSVPMRRGPRPDLPYETELLHGEIIDIYESAAGWAWGQARRDGYCGYVPQEALAPLVEPTHRVVALRTFRYPSAGIKATPLGFLPCGAVVRVDAEEGKFARTPAGYLFAAHLVPLAARAADPVAEAERFLGTPYLWGGRTSLGIDCSALVQGAALACGISAARDSDMQEEALGVPLPLAQDPAGYRRGDLLFWPGHVALCQGEGRMIHATAHAMAVISEPIGPALARIAAAGSALRSARRLPAG